MYIGEIVEANPMLTPPRIRQATNKLKFEANAIPSEEITKFPADTSRIGFRPSRSLTGPETSDPTKHPTSAQLCAHPTGDIKLALIFTQNAADAETSAAVF
jgi:hypothetical protein